MLSTNQHKERSIILVTGANKGIGYYLVKKLLEQTQSCGQLILLGCRDLKRGEAALVQLGSPTNVCLTQLDTSSQESIQQAANEIRTKYGPILDIVVNNAAILSKELTIDEARKVFTINYYGIKKLNEFLLPLMKENGRIINVSSQYGPMMLYQSSTDVQNKYTSMTLTFEELDDLVEEFIEAFETNSLNEKGYHMNQTPPLIYGVSKAALNSLTQIEARQWEKIKNLLVVSVSPGFCSTDMTNNSAEARSPELGAESILHAINTHRNQLVNGGFYRDGLLLPLISPPN